MVMGGRADLEMMRDVRRVRPQGDGGQGRADLVMVVGWGGV